MKGNAFIFYRQLTHVHKTRQDKTRQDKTRQDKTRQDKTRQDKNLFLLIFKYSNYIWINEIRNVSTIATWNNHLG